MRRSTDDELIQGEIDGVNSAEESARLKEILASNPELDARFGSLKRVAESLGGAERFDPPPGFTNGVMATVHRRRMEAAERPGWRETLRSLFAPAPLAACACALVIGVVLGGLLPSDSGLFSRSEREALSGTALSGGQLAGRGLLDRQPIARTGVRGEAVTRVDAGLLVVEVWLDADLPVAVSLDLGGTGLSPRSFSQDVPSGGDLVIADDGVRFTHPAGRNRYSLAFAAGELPGRSLLLRVGDGEVLDLAVGRGEGPR